MSSDQWGNCKRIDNSSYENKEKRSAILLFNLYSILIITYVWMRKKMYMMFAAKSLCVMISFILSDDIVI